MKEIMQTQTTSIDQAETLARLSAILNARPWDEVRAGIPDWHPRMDGEEDDDADFEPIEDDDDDTSNNHEEDDDDQYVRVPRSQLDEHNRLKREAAEAQKAARAAQREAKRQREREQRESGQYDELLAEKDEEVLAAAARAEAAEWQLEQFQRTNRITGAATRLGFKDPGDAVRFLDDDDTEDEVSTERALKRLAREKPYLIDNQRRSGAPVNGESGIGLSLDDIKKMSQEEINSRWEEVQQALAQGTA
jgi:hypothetical protein